MPLSLVAVSMATSFFVFMAIGVQSAVNLRADLQRSLVSEARALSAIVTEAVRHDDVWTAYTAVNGGRYSGIEYDERESFRVVLDQYGRIFASDRPRQFPLAAALDDTPLAWLLADMTLQARGGAVSHAEWDGRQFVLLPLLSEDGQVGTLLMAGPKDAVRIRLLALLKQGLLVMIGLLAVIVPLGWAWGSRLVAPLVQLAQCMRRISQDRIEDLECPVYTGGDEIGQLGQGFRSMLEELRAKQELERQMLAQDRLAAIGRIAGGVAHEINNPLTGMLVAIDSYRQQPASARNHDKTLGLIERGLRQIQETVSALLVECRVERRDCTPDDIDDIERLLQANEAARRVALSWHNGLQAPLPLPANAVRQILLNLGLNALQAAAGSGGGSVRVDIEQSGRDLILAVSNDGEPIPQSQLEHIFEPFHTGRPGGTGLGLWITYQIVVQLGGEIEVSSDDQGTCFRAVLPLEEGAVAELAEGRR
ncbi:MAG: sensor histidine kinase [Gammaproteobacteria bacterium]|nr:MAG: sensor histidine kinase [Gammaproteobacteria bacterium]